MTVANIRPARRRYLALAGQNAWFGGSQSPYRLVHDRQADRGSAYRLLADGYVIKEG